MAHTQMGVKQIWGTELDANDSSAQEQLGIKRYEHDPVTDSVVKVYRYVQFNDGTAAGGAAAAGDVLVFRNTDANGYTVTDDVSDGSQAAFAGVAIGALTDTYYGWIQCGGFCSNITTDGGVAAGDPLIPDTVDGTADTMAAGEEHYVFGYALAADSGTTLADAIIFDR